MQAVQQFRKIKHPDEPVSPGYRADIISVIAVFLPTPRCSSGKMSRPGR